MHDPGNEPHDQDFEAHIDDVQPVDELEEAKSGLIDRKELKTRLRASAKSAGNKIAVAKLEQQIDDIRSQALADAGEILAKAEREQQKLIDKFEGKKGFPIVKTIAGSAIALGIAWSVVQHDDKLGWEAPEALKEGQQTIINFAKDSLANDDVPAKDSSSARIQIGAYKNADKASSIKSAAEFALSTTFSVSQENGHYIVRSDEPVNGGCDALEGKFTQKMDCLELGQK